MHKHILLTVLSLVALAAVVAATTALGANGKTGSKQANTAVQVDVFSPQNGDIAGKADVLVDAVLHSPDADQSGMTGRHVSSRV